MKSAYLASQRLLGGLIALLGVVMAVSTLARGGGPLALGFVVGVLFALLGAGRVWIATRRPTDGEGG